MQKFVVGCVICFLVTFGWSDHSLGEQAPVPRGELRVVDKSPLNFIWVALNIFEHLVEFDKDGVLVPRLATGWRWLDDRTLEVTLRQGVQFHNGEVFDADSVKLNWEENIRVRQPHLLGEFMNFKPGSRLEIIDAQTVRFVFPVPDGAALVKLSAMHIASRQFYRDVGWGEKSW
jgi:ABC-type transport system substrate-binding protein